MIDKKHFDSLKMIDYDLQIAIANMDKVDIPVVIINEMKEVLKHISKALDILEWDKE